MAGLNVNWNNAYAMDSLYGANPYATNSLMSPYASTMNDDFMAQSAFGNSLGQQQSLGYPSAFQGYQGLQQPTTDTFQSQAQGGGSWIPASPKVLFGKHGVYRTAPIRKSELVRWNRSAFQC